MSEIEPIELAERQIKKCKEYLSIYGEDTEVRYFLEYAEAFLLVQTNTTGEG